jgi:vacuolar-type H+-ATPase subunit F/Vma7
MGRVCAIGERGLVQGYGLAGAQVTIAESASAVRAAWHALPLDAAIVILTPAAATVLGATAASDSAQRLVVTLP